MILMQKAFGGTLVLELGQGSREIEKQVPEIQHTSESSK